MKKIISILAIGVLIISGLGAVSVENNKTFNLKTEEKQLIFSESITKDESEYLTVNLKEATTSFLDAGKPSLPIVSQVYTFPFKTKINNVEVIFSEPKEIVLSKEIKPASKPIMLNTESQTTNQIEKDMEIYESSNLYPSTTFSYTVGAGLSNKEHVIFLTIKCYPVRYSPVKNILYYSESANIKISYEEPTNPVSFSDEYDLVIISPSEFSDTLQPLINHKNSYGVNTTLKTTEEIFSEYDGFDEIEDIKYFIKDAIETYNVEYVLLIGGVEKLPIRTTWFFERHHDDYWNESILSDLYYADIYDQYSNFCSWDSNGNHLYGECFENIPGGVNDTVDLFADVNIGRIPCKTKNELRTVINKIIYYEKNTRESSWFNNIILIGGDTFPGWSIYEGEKKNTVTQQIMSDFTPTKLWTSDETFNARAFNKALNEGAGFVDYSGHGYEIGISTHPPDSNKWIGYYFDDLFRASNGEKQPIIFFDACLTAKLDFDFSEFINYIVSYILPFKSNNNLDSKTFTSSNILKSVTQSISEKQLPCFAWSFVKKKYNGAIATIGATRTAYTHVDAGGVHGGAGLLSIKFFAAHATCDTIGQMLTKAQNDYINLAYKDYFTIEEFIIVGDPSLRVGGY